jgi:Phage integrase family
MDNYPTDRRGYKRSLVTVPGYRRGLPPANKGMKTRAEVLPPEDVRTLLASYGTSPHDLRDRALIVLLYRAGLKLIEVIGLGRPDYDRRAGTLRVAARPGVPERTESLDLQSRQALDAWMEARKTEGVSKSAPIFCVLLGNTKNLPIGDAYVRELLKKRATKLDIEGRVHPEGLRRSGQVHRKGARNRLTAHLEEYLDDETFQLRYPVAYDQWESALDLFNANPERHATRIGHDCREAMSSFMSAKVALHGIEPSGDGTFARLDDLVESAVPGKAASKQLKALKEYWNAISGLAQRQEHGGKREGEALSPTDAQRLISYTMLVMLETDRALPQK